MLVVMVMGTTFIWRSYHPLEAQSTPPSTDPSGLVELPCWSYAVHWVMSVSLQSYTYCILFIAVVPGSYYEIQRSNDSRAVALTLVLNKLASIGQHYMNFELIKNKINNKIAKSALKTYL